MTGPKQRPPVPFPSKNLTVEFGSRGAVPTGEARDEAAAASLSEGGGRQARRPPGAGDAGDASDDADLVTRSRAGDMRAFESIYRRHAGRLYSLACRMAGSPEDGEDLLQEIFLQAHRKLDSFKGDATLGTWLYRLALNHCLDYVRSRQAKMSKLTTSLDAESEREPAARRETPIARLDLDRALERLPDGCREAFVLHDVEGFDHKEIGRLLGIAEGTSKSQVFKARLKLRRLLK